MQNVLAYNFDEDDFTAEWSSWAIGQKKEVTIEQDETYYVPLGSQCLLPTFFTVNAEDLKDYTPPITSLGSICSLLIRYEPYKVFFKDSPLTYEKHILENDYCNEDPIQIKIESKHPEEGKQLLFKHLYNVYQECSETNWDGYDAIPVSNSTYFEAIKLIELLPSNIPEPEIIPEPTGEIVFEWYKGKQFVFVISVGGKNIITYAGLFGKSRKTHGTEYFANNLPLVIIENIQRLLL